MKDLNATERAMRYRNVGRDGIPYGSMIDDVTPSSMYSEPGVPEPFTPPDKSNFIPGNPELRRELKEFARKTNRAIKEVARRARR